MVLKTGQGRYASKSGLFLIELILSIFFFIVAAAVSLLLFVRSHLASERAVCISNALLHTQNIAEVFLSGDGSFSSVQALYGSNQADIPAFFDTPRTRMLLLFDGDWRRTANADSAKYCVLADYKSDADFSYVTVYVSKFFPSLMDDISSESISNGDGSNVFSSADIIHRQELKKYLSRGR